MIQIFCGDGKGKTSSAVGSAIRFAGSGGKVLVFQFLKGNTSSERNILAKTENIKLIDGMEKVKFTFSMSEAEKLSAHKFYDDKLDFLFSEAENYGMIVLDEVIGAVNAKLVTETKLIDYLEEYGQSLELILTGRNPPEKILSIADYVSEIHALKHPYSLGVYARKGIEY